MKDVPNTPPFSFVQILYVFAMHSFCSLVISYSSSIISCSYSKRTLPDSKCSSGGAWIFTMGEALLSEFETELSSVIILVSLLILLKS